MNKIIHIAICALLFAGCAHSPPPTKSEACCGLSATEWDTYKAHAVSTMQTQSVLKWNGDPMPKERLLVAEDRKIWGTTDSEDGHAAPAHVTIYVPLEFTHPYDVNHVVVEYLHPSREITRVYATEVMH